MDTNGDRVRAIADSLDCLTEDEFTALAGITPLTAESWRKRGKGPAYVLFGTRYYYPKKIIAAHLESLVRERPAAAAKAQL